MKETINLEACAKCGGKCCYLPETSDRMYTIGQMQIPMDLLIQSWMEQFPTDGPEPMYDPKLAQPGGPCPYLKEGEGCILERPARPVFCRTYMCDLGNVDLVAE